MVSLDLPLPMVESLWRVLSPDERARAAAFRLEAHLARFVAARGLLRAVLARHLERAPASLVFGYGPWGKPFLADEKGPNGLRFNLSHAGRVMLVALARGGEVGVDVEVPRPGVAPERVAEAAFSQSEKAALVALPESDRDAAILRGWTRKEAVIKATGLGVALAPDRVEVSLAPHAAALIRIDGDRRRAKRWSLHHLVLGEGHVGALAAESERLAFFKVPRRIAIVPEIPKGPTGKPQRIGLAEKLGLGR